MIVYSVFLTLVILIDISAEVLCSLMYNEALYLLLGIVEAKVSFAIYYLENLVFN